MTQLVPIQKIFTIDEFQPRVKGIDINHVRSLEETPEQWPPLVCFQIGDEFLIGDGRHRFEAGKRLGLEFLPIDVVDQPADGDFRGFAFRLNLLHGRPMSLEDRRQRAAEVLAARPGLSDRKIGDQTGLSPTTIGKIRAEMLAVHSGQSIRDQKLSDEGSEERPIANYLRRLNSVLQHQYELKDWVSPGDAAIACLNVLGESAALDLADDLKPAIADILKVVDVLRPEAKSCYRAQT